jgi:hypothetical protein
MSSESLRSVARLALHSDFSGDEVDALVDAFSLPRVRSQMVSLGVCEADASDISVARLYFSRRCSIISPNDYFDEAWYIGHYEDVRAAIRSGGLISGFVHFIKDGLRDGRWPNQSLFTAAACCAAPGLPRDHIDADAYAARNPAVKPFLQAFPSLTALLHYNNYGRLLGYAADAAALVSPQSLALRAAEAEFDPVFYARRYLAAPELAARRDDPFSHYAQEGMRAGHSPNGWFDEGWYRAFYKEVREAIEEGWLPSGFYHYVISGRGEGRLPRYDLTAALEARVPGLTAPSLLTRAATLRTRLQGMVSLPKCVERAPAQRMIWLLLPMLNPDIVYGGYRAALELICALRRDGHAVTIVTTEEAPNKAYFLWGEGAGHIRSTLGQVDVVGLEDLTLAGIGSEDVFIAYAVWDLRVAAQLAGLTRHTRPMLLLQEYEPVFHDNGAQRALCEAMYRVAHYPVVNSQFLLSYLEKHRVGVFGHAMPPRQGRDYAVFEHKVNILPPQTAKAMQVRKNRVLAVYARPEAHAGRNLFELALLALQDLCGRGVFGPEWSFVGVGALSRIPPVPLGGGHELVLKAKLPEHEYRQMMAEMDIGISLMYAPHPSVVPFEFATTGALVVTNIYENRSSAELRAICGNIVPCEVSLESVCAAIEDALSRVADATARAQHAYRPTSQSWEQIFSPDFIAAVLAANTGRPARDAVVVDFPPRRRPAAAARLKPPPRKAARRTAVKESLP